MDKYWDSVPHPGSMDTESSFTKLLIIICRDLKTNKSTSTSFLDVTGNQCRSFRIGEIWSLFFSFYQKAVAFCNNCNGLINCSFVWGFFFGGGGASIKESFTVI